MKKLWIPVLALVLVLVLAAGWMLWKKQAVSESAQSATEPAETKPLAPDFVVYDPEGKAVSLSDFRGKTVVVNFWTSWCGPCRQEMPEFEALYKEIGDEVAFLMVNVTASENSKSDPEQLIRELGYTFPVYYDLTDEAASVYGISSFPTTFFISPEGEAIARAVGAIDGETVRRGIAMTQTAQSE